MSRIIFHIGPHKTGSSYLQKTFFENSVFLDKNKILYPCKLVGPEYGHHQLHELLEQNKLSEVQLFLDEILKYDGLVVISSENFDRLEEAQIKFLADYLRNFDVTIAFVKRRISNLLVSSWQEEVKHGAVETFFEFIFPHILFPFKSKLLNGVSILEPYKKLFGVENIKVIPYSSGEKEDLFDIFCTHLKINGVSGIGSGESFNKSLPIHDVELIRILNSKAKAAGILTGDNIRNEYIRLRSEGGISLNMLDFWFAAMEKQVISANFHESHILSMMEHHFASNFGINSLECENDKGKMDIPLSSWALSAQFSESLEELYKIVCQKQK